MTRSSLLSWKLAAGGYILLLGIYAFFSYSLTDPNLILSHWLPYWQFQNKMWRTFFDQPHILSWTYGLIITLIWLAYGWWVKSWQRLQLRLRAKLLTVVPWLLIVPLLFSYNALSHDVFNYIFNARMVVKYQVNPHQRVALDFAYDPWTRFMHNTHTPAPYAYGWTGLSLLTYLVGFEKFTFTWWLFRLMSVASLGGLIWLLNHQSRRHLTNQFSSTWLGWLIFNPLLLIEIVGNSHNDLWMMVPAVAAVWLVTKKNRSWLEVGGSIILFLFSVAIKYASLALLPLWLLLLISPQLKSFKLKSLKAGLKFVDRHWALIASLLMFLPLLTVRSQQFHPWYLSWPLVWLPLIRWRPWKTGLIVLSISSLYRYLPYFWVGEFTNQVLIQQKLITWVPWGLFWLGWLLTWRHGQKT